MGSVELLNPKGLWLLTGFVPLVIFYILKIKRQRIKVPSTWLWAEARRDLLAKSPFKKLIPELSLLLQILALLALTAALTRPALRGGRIDGDHVAIIIDTSASMGTLARGADGKDTTRMAEALTAANDVLDALAPGADAIVIESSREPKVVSPLDRDVRKLKGALAQVAVRDVEGDLGIAVALGADRLRAVGGKRRIVVITDGALAHGGPVAAAGIPTQVITVGDARDNAGIVRIDVRSGNDPATHREQAQVFVMLQNYAATPRDAYVTLSIDGHKDPKTSRRMLIPAHDKSPVVLTFSPDAIDYGKGMTVELSPPDALVIDDKAYARVPEGHKMPVTIASKVDYSWIMRALDADGDVDLQKLNLAQLATVNIDPEALVVVEGACPESIPGRDVLIVAPPEGNCLGIDVGKSVEQPQLTSWEAGDTRFRFLTLDGVHLTKANPLAAQGAGASLARAGTVTIIGDASVPGSAATVVGFDVGESDWPLKASFVLFIRNVVEGARLHRSQGAVGPVRTGDPLRIALPADVTKITVDGPGMPEHDVDCKGGFAIVPPVERAGLYHAKWTTPHVGSVLVAANLTSEKESDITPRPVTVDATAGSSTSASRLADAHHEWGLWLALLATLLIAIDLFWLTRQSPAPKPKAERAT